MIINAENLIIGRFATVAAKKAIMGEKVTIINCEKGIITGNKYRIFSHYKQKRDRGTFKGPFVLRLPDRFVKRTIRGMLPYKQPKGRAAYDNIKCFARVPEGQDIKAAVTIEDANIKKLSSQEYISVKELCKNLGAKL